MSNNAPDYNDNLAFEPKETKLIGKYKKGGVFYIDLPTKDLLTKIDNAIGEK